EEAPSEPEEKERPDESEIKPTEPNATLDYAIFSDSKKGSPDKVTLPAAGEEVLSRRLENLPNIDLTEGKQQQRWAWTLRDSLSKLLVGNVYTDRINESGTDFRQYF